MPITRDQPQTRSRWGVPIGAGCLGIPLFVMLSLGTFLAIRRKPVIYRNAWMVGCAWPANDNTYANGMTNGYTHATWFSTSGTVEDSWTIRWGNCAFYLVRNDDIANRTLSDDD